MRAVLLATALSVSTSAGQPRVILDCAAFKKLPGGAWEATKGTAVTVADSERQTRDTFSIAKGSSLAADQKTKPPARDEALANLVDGMTRTIDIVGELDKRCR